MKTRLQGETRAAVALLGVVVVIVGGVAGTTVGWWLGVPIALAGAAAVTLGLWPSRRGALPPIGGEQHPDVLRAVSKHFGGM